MCREVTENRGFKTQAQGFAPAWKRGLGQRPICNKNITEKLSAHITELFKT